MAVEVHTRFGVKNNVTSKKQKHHVKRCFIRKMFIKKYFNIMCFKANCVRNRLFGIWSGSTATTAKRQRLCRCEVNISQKPVTSLKIVAAKDFLSTHWFESKCTRFVAQVRVLVENRACKALKLGLHRRMKSESFFRVSRLSDTCGLWVENRRF